MNAAKEEAAQAVAASEAEAAKAAPADRALHNCDSLGEGPTAAAVKAVDPRTIPGAKIKVTNTTISATVLRHMHPNVKVRLDADGKDVFKKVAETTLVQAAPPDPRQVEGAKIKFRHGNADVEAVVVKNHGLQIKVKYNDPSFGEKRVFKKLDETTLVAAFGSYK